MLNSPKNILVIDDENHLLVGVKALLDREGYKAIATNNSISSIQIARDCKPDLIICDVMMPQMDGFKVRQTLNEYPETKNIPFLFLSARISQTDKLKGLNSGADDYITKPFDHRELLARISAIFNRYNKAQEDMRRQMDYQISQFQKEISHNISHELRTPLAQILLALDMVLRDKYNSPEDLKQFMEIALSQSRKLNGVIDDLIFISNYDRGEVNTLRQKINIQFDFKDVIQALQSQYTDKNLNIQVNIAPDVTIHAPRREFRQVVYHLVDNAVKFSMPLTDILVELDSNGVGGFILTITDHGPGIPQEFAEKVFKRYFQISQGDRRTHNGLGVGLNIARIFSQALEGDTIILPSTYGCRIRMIVPPCKLDMP